MKLSLIGRRAAMAGLAVGLACVSASGAIDGIVTAGDLYGPALAVQTTETQFGDNQSELNAAYGRISGGRLHLAFTGNIENNFNKIEVFLDSRAGGQNVYSSAGNDSTANINGFTFDSGFNADYHLIFRRGNFGGDRFDVDISDLQAGTFSSYPNIFGGVQTGSGSTGTGINASPIQVAYDNSNIAGVLGGTGAANQAAAASVTTGLEFSIDLGDILAAGEVRVFAFIGNGDHNYNSNQLLPGLVNPQGNLGGDGSGGFNGTIGQLNMNNYYPGAAEGWFTVVPAPGAAALLGLGGLAAIRRRR